MTTINVAFIVTDSTDIEDHASLEYEPSQVLERKIEALAEILGCTEEQAERVFFERL